jgi:hypothetical protein
MAGMHPSEGTSHEVMAGRSPRPAGDESAYAADPAPAGRRRRWWIPVAWVLGTAVFFVANVRLSQTNATNSDGSSITLQAWAMLHGNPLLHGWEAAQVSFYTTELPEYMLVLLAHGLNAGAVHIASAATYTLAMLLVALLAKGDTTGREAVVRVAISAGIMIAPQLDAGTYILLNSPDHFGTSVPILLAWLIIDRARPRWYVPAAVVVILALTQIGDVTGLFIAVIPLALVAAYRVLRARFGAKLPLGSQRYDIALAGTAVAAAVIGFAVPHVITVLGGFTAEPAATQLSPVNLMFGRNLKVTGEGLLVLVGADFFGVRQGARVAFEALHLVGAAVGLAGICLGVGRFFRKDADRVSQLLILGIVLNLASFVAGVHAKELSYVREISPVLPFAAALAGRLLAKRLLAIRIAPVLVPALTVVLCGYLAGLVYEIRQPVVPAQNAQLATWLRDHGLRSGLSGYWQSNVVTLTTGGEVAIRPLEPDRGGVQGINRLTDRRWYDPRLAYANFVVLYPGYNGTEPFTEFTGIPGFPFQGLVEQTFGRPARIYHDGPYTIFVWNKNILSDLPKQVATAAPGGGLA